MQPPIINKASSAPLSAHRRGRCGAPGMTLIEMTIVILVLLSLITIMFFGAQAWKRGSDRTMCILQIQNVQKGLRSFSNLNGYAPGDNATNLQGQVIGMGKFIEATPVCPTNGTYSFGPTFGPDTIPPIGELYMQCSLGSSEQHEPPSHGDW